MVNIGLPSPDHPNKGWKVWIASTVLVIITGLFVIARLIGRTMKGGVKIDDYTIIAAQVNYHVFQIQCAVMSLTSQFLLPDFNHHSHGYRRYGCVLSLSCANY